MSLVQRRMHNARAWCGLIQDTMEGQGTVSYQASSGGARAREGRQPTQCSSGSCCCQRLEGRHMGRDVDLVGAGHVRAGRLVMDPGL